MSSRSGIRATPVLHGRIQAGLLMEVYNHCISGRFVLLYYICDFYFCCKFYYYFYYLYYVTGVKLQRLAALKLQPCLNVVLMENKTMGTKSNLCWHNCEKGESTA